MHDEFEPHASAHGRFAKNGANVQQTNAAHFQQVLQQLRALALDGVLVDAVEVHGIIGDQAVAARDQLQSQLALAQAGFARDQHAQAQNVHEHTVHGDTVSKMLGQVGVQYVNHKPRGLVRGKQRDLCALTQRQQLFWWT